MRRPLHEDQVFTVEIFIQELSGCIATFAEAFIVQVDGEERFTYAAMLFW